MGETGGNVLHRSHTACGETRELSVAEASELSVVDAVAFTPLAKALISFGSHTLMYDAVPQMTADAALCIVHEPCLCCVNAAVLRAV